MKFCELFFKLFPVLFEIPELHWSLKGKFSHCFYWRKLLLFLCFFKWCTLWLMSGRSLQYLGSVFFVFQAQCIVLFDHLLGKGTDKKLIFTYIIITTVAFLKQTVCVQQNCLETLVIIFLPLPVNHFIVISRIIVMFQPVYLDVIFSIFSTSIVPLIKNEFMVMWSFQGTNLWFTRDW